MGGRTGTGRGGWRLRRPTLGETVELVVGEALVLGVGAAVVAVTQWSPLWWAVAGAMVLVGVRWVVVLGDRPASAHWGSGAPVGRGAAPYVYGAGAGILGGSLGGGLGGGFDGGAGGAGGGGGDGGGGC